MTTAQRLPRSPELMNRDDTALLVVDVQAKLLPLIKGSGRMVWNVRRLIDGAKILGLPIAATGRAYIPLAGKRFRILRSREAYSRPEESALLLGVSQ